MESEGFCYLSVLIDNTDHALWGQLEGKTCVKCKSEFKVQIWHDIWIQAMTWYWESPHAGIISEMLPIQPKVVEFKPQL